MDLYTFIKLFFFASLSIACLSLSGLHFRAVEKKNILKTSQNSVWPLQPERNEVFPFDISMLPVTC